MEALNIVQNKEKIKYYKFFNPNFNLCVETYLRLRLIVNRLYDSSIEYKKGIDPDSAFAAICHGLQHCRVQAGSPTFFINETCSAGNPLIVDTDGLVYCTYIC